MIEKLEGQELLPPEAPLEGGRATGGAGDAVDAPLEATEPAAEPLIALEGAELRGAVEAVLFSVAEPMAIRALADVVGSGVHEVRAAVEDLRLEYVTGGRAFRIEDIAGGVQLLTQSRYDPWIRRLRQKEKEGRLTPAALESLAVIAYKQPISKADLEGIRGVGCGPTLKTLLERGLIQVVGRSEALGKPLLYGTTKRFLESFGIASVRELPQPELAERPAQHEPTPEPPAPEVGEQVEVMAEEAAEAIESRETPGDASPKNDDRQASIAEASGPLS